MFRDSSTLNPLAFFSGSVSYSQTEKPDRDSLEPHQTFSSKYPTHFKSVSLLRPFTRISITRFQDEVTREKEED